MQSNDLSLVSIEFKRIQSYLFAVPRLSAMVGANSLLGETLRGVVRRSGAAGVTFDASVESLPALAVRCGSAWPGDISSQLLAQPPADDDPLLLDGVQQDDPGTVARATGVLSRDGGHFEAIFPSEERGRKFLDEAQELIHKRLPGVPFECRLTRISRVDERHREERAQEHKTPASMAALDLPQATVCAFDGNEPASTALNDADGETPASQSVAARHNYGRRFDAGKSHDVLGILRPTLLKDLGLSDVGQNAFPADFDRLATSGYLAVVHVDGNSVGTRLSKYQGSGGSGDFFEQWRRRESFFHILRTGLRTAVCQALPQVFGGYRTDSGCAPLRLLMLGGDDLSMVCAAPLALRFIVALAKAMLQSTQNLPDGQDDTCAPLTFGAGVAIVQQNFPFYRGYELAEQLAKSAKHLKASLPQRDGNVVDWLVVSEAWHGDIESTRRQQCLMDDLVLSAKPYRVLGSQAALPAEDPGKSADKSLEEMLEDAEELANGTRQDRVARSQLHALARALRRGRHTARFAAAVLPENPRAELEKMNYLSTDDGPWARHVAGDRRLTYVLDLLELHELEMLCNEAESSGHLIRNETGPVARETA